MKKNFLNISSVLLAFFVVFLSVGVSVSKMLCSKDGKLFLGTEVPNCMQQKEIFCIVDSQEFTCCKKSDYVESCCPQTEDGTCASETANFQFDFETLVPTLVLKFKEHLILVFICILYEFAYDVKNNDTYFWEVPILSNFFKPKLEEIQLFLL